VGNQSNRYNPGENGSPFKALQPRQKPLQDGLITAVAILISACIPLMYLWDRSIDSLDREMKTALLETAESAAMLVDGDLHRTFIDPEMESGEDYQTETDKLRRFMQKNPRLAYVYTTILTNDAVHFILDAALPGDLDGDGVDDHSYIMDTYESPSQELLTSLRMESIGIDQKAYTDIWGTFISAYAPVLDREGKVAGILGVDIRAEDFVESLSDIRRAAIAGICLAFLISILVGFLVYSLHHRTAKSQQDALASLKGRAHAEMRYRQLFEQTPIGIMNYSLDLKVTDCNDAFAEILKTRRDGLIGFEIESLKDTRILPGIREALDGREGIYTGPYHTTTSNRNLWIKIHTGPMRNTAGDIVGGIAIVEDITTRHWNESMSEAEKRLLGMIARAEPLEPTLTHLVQSMESLIPDSICSILFLDESGKRLLHGIAPSLPQEYNNAIHNTPIGPAAGSCGTAAYTGKLVIVPDVMTHPFWKDYRELAARHHLRACWSMPIRSGMDKIIGTFAIYCREVYEPGIEEITLLEQAGYLAGIAMDRDRFAMDLSHERNLLRTLIDNLPDVVCIKDRDHRYLAANRAAARFLGVASEDDLIGKSDAELLSAPKAEKQHQMENRVLDGTAIMNESSTLTQKDGSIIHLSTSVMPLRKPSGEIIGLIVIGRDVTNQHRAQEEIIKNQKLESLGQLAGGIAHDFNNILTSILGNLSLIRQPDHSSEPEQSDILKEAESATLRARDLAQQLLTFAKGGQPVRKHSDVASVVRDAALIAANETSCQVEFKLAPDLWPAEIDAVQIGQVINALITNASQAMPPGGTVVISGTNVTVAEDNPHKLPPGDYVSVAAKDSGTGIPDTIIGKIFDPYFTTKKSGSGLGLSTAFSIITKHGGRIFVTSLPGKGATFTLVLPASRSSIQTPDVASPVPPGPRRILLMDDEEAIVKISSRILERVGYEVRAARDGQEAIRLFKRAREEGKPFDVTILDLTIPGGMGGKETFDELKKSTPPSKLLFPAATPSRTSWPGTNHSVSAG